jgi:hypothetical protein
VNVKAFLVDALTSALDLGLATPDDVVRHVTPDVLAAHLPRPLWARLLTACFGAPHVDAQLVVETVGVANLCEHLPPALLWTCLAELGARALDHDFVPPARAEQSVAIGTPSPPVAAVKPLAIDSPPPPEPPKPTRPAPSNPGPSIPTPGTSPLAEIAADIDSELAASSSTPAPSRARTPTNRFRPSSTNSIGRLAGARRPQASVPTPEPAPAAAPPPTEPVPIVRRGQTEADLEVETAVGDAADWRAALAVEDEQLVEWSSAESTRPSDDRKR